MQQLAFEYIKNKIYKKDMFKYYDMLSEDLIFNFNNNLIKST